MHLLIRIPLLVALLSLSIVHCGSKGALSPEEAFARLKIAYEKSDAAAVEDLLSTNSKKKITAIIGAMARMNEDQRAALGASLGVDADSLAKLTVRGYIALQFSRGDRLGADVYRDILAQRILRVDRKGVIATVTVTNGMGIVFLKEGPYWKLDMSD